MDIWITLRDGRTVPLTGVTAVASVTTQGTRTTQTAATNSTVTVTVTSTANMQVGMSVFGSGIPAGATIAAILSATTFQLSVAATTTVASQTIEVIGITHADKVLIQMDSGWYRDIFSAKGLGFAYDSAVGYYFDSYAGTPPVGADPISVQSDEVVHHALRQTSWYEAMWAFTVTVNAETLQLFWRKYEVVGFGNVEPTI